MLRKFVKALIPRQLFRSIEPYGHWAEAILANIIYGFPARNLHVIGVTGTDGKTTTTTLIWQMLKEAGYKVGYMTTVGYGTHKYQKSLLIHMTTLQSFPLMRRIRDLKADGIEWLVLETSSHALAQHRVAGIPYEVGVMTNVNLDHLDYHGTFERYRDAKRRLFQIANRHGLKVGVANADNPSGELFAAAVAHPILYGIEKGDLRATDIKSTSSGNSFTVVYRPKTSSSTGRPPQAGVNHEDPPVKPRDDGKGELKIQTSLPGRFNVYNCLAAVGVGMAVGLTKEQIKRGIAALKAVEGRMNTIDEGQDFALIVDYAATPASFEAVLSGIKPAVQGRLITVFGSAGRRDEAKRTVQGEIAGRYSDMVVVTEEDDRDVDGVEIMDQIASGAEKAGKVRDKDLFLIHDRTEAIQFAVNEAKAGDTVILLGKGHEKTIERADGEHSWDEAAEARKAIKARSVN